MTSVEWAVSCQQCGILGEHLTAQQAVRLAEKHGRDTQHPTIQTGTALPR